MKNATPSDKKRGLAINKINSFETEKIAGRYRRIGGFEGHDFDFLIDKYDWTYLPLRNEIVDDIIESNQKVKRAFTNFRKALTKKYPEYKYLIERGDWKYILAELFLFGDIQPDTVVPFGNVSWSENKDGEKALYLKLLPSADKQQVIDFLKVPENNINKKFKEIGIVVPKVKGRTSKDTYRLDFWVRVLDTFSSDEIREAFALRYSNEYNIEFMLSGKRKSLARVKYELISHYVFHRFHIFGTNKKPYSANYVKLIVEKAKKQKTEIKAGLFKTVP
jgi:hypothetical protein